MFCFSAKCPVDADAGILRPRVEQQGHRPEEIPVEAHNDTC